MPRLNSYFMSTVIAGIENVANDEGYNLIITQSSESAEKEKLSAKTMFNSRVDGLLVSLSYDTNDLLHFETALEGGELDLQQAMQLGTAEGLGLDVLIAVADHLRRQTAGDAITYVVNRNINFTNVLIDNRRSAYEATKHLIGQGCKQIVHITAQLKRNVYVDRFKGYKQALEENSIPFKDEFLIIGNLSIEAGAQAAETILKMDPLPEGVFVANDNCAVGCMLSLKQAGIRIPENIAFVGFNNDPVSKVIEPNLTTVNYFPFGRRGYLRGKLACRSYRTPL